MASASRKDDSHTPGPGLEQHLTWLLQCAESLQAGGGGFTVFIGGEEGAGHTTLLDAFVNDLVRRPDGPLVLTGTFESGRYVAKSNSGDGLGRAARALAGVVTAAGPLDPLAGLAAQLVSQSSGALGAVNALTEKSTKEHPLDLVPRLLRRAAEIEGPIVCVIHDADKSEQGWWADLMLTFARQVSVDLPLLLVFAVDGPDELGDHEPGESPGLYAARQLVEEEIAAWLPLRRVSIADLVDWIGPTDREIPNALAEVTGGRAGWAAEIWSEWSERGVVRRDGGRLRFSPDGRRTALAPLNELLGWRLQELMDGQDLPRVSLARQTLTLASLEGSVFTADAVATVLKRDPDEVIDLLDDWLSTDSGQTRALVGELPTLTVADEAGTRHIRRYRFLAKLDWLVFRHYGIGKEEKRAGSYLAIGRALHSLYGSESHLIARTLAEVFSRGNDEDAAQYFLHMHTVTTDCETLIWRARTALELPKTTGQHELNRAALVLVQAAGALYNTGPWGEGLRFSEAAAELTNLTSLRSAGLYYAAWYCAQLEDRDTARIYLERALEGREHERDRQGIADTRHQLANLDFFGDLLDQAEHGYREVVELRRENEDPRGEAVAWEALGDVFQDREEYGRAQSAFEKSIELCREAERPNDEASTRLRLVRLLFYYGDLDPEVGIEEMQEILAINRAYGDRHHEAVSLRLLAELEQDRGNGAAALTAAKASLSAMRELGEPDLSRALELIEEIEREA